MLLFRSEELIDHWCRQKNIERGEVLTINQVWNLSKLWYHNRLSQEYHGRSQEQVAGIFKQAGLNSPFWYV
jgi:hypothetical protein